MEERNIFCPKCCERQDVIGPKAIMLLLGDRFFEMSTAADWSVRKEALDKLQNILKSNPRLKDGDYRPLLNHLRKIIISDLCVIVVGLAVQCVTSLAKGLGKHFGQYAEGMCQVLFEKFVEKRQRMTELLREALDTIFETTRFESLLNTVTRLLKHPNPSIRYEIILYLARSFPKCSRRVFSKPQFQQLVLSLKSLLGDGDIVIREKTLAALGAAVQVGGEKAILPYLRDLDLASKAKIEVYQMRAWEIAKTYNEMKFPNFKERPREPNINECPFSVSTASQVSIMPKDDLSRSDVVYTLSNGSINTVSLHGLATQSEKLVMALTRNHPRRSVSILRTKNLSTATDDSKTERIRTKPLKKELSLPVGCQLDRVKCITPVGALNPEPRQSTYSNFDVEEQKSSKNDKTQEKDSDSLLELKDEIKIPQLTDECLANVAQHLNDLVKEQHLITYRQTNEAIGVLKDEKTQSTIGSSVVEPETEIEDSQIGFTKKELDDLLTILNAARFRARTKGSCGGKRSHTKKHSRHTTMSRGFLDKADHKETQCTSGVSLLDKPTQTIINKDEKRNSISCIINCCEKCTRLLLATAQPNSRYIIPVNPNQMNPQQSAAESSDYTVYREVVSSDRMTVKTDSDLIKISLEQQLIPDESEMSNNLEESKSYDVNNVVTIHNADAHGRPAKLPSCINRIEATEESLDLSMSEQEAAPERKFNPKFRDRRTYCTRTGKISTCNKTTYVTTTSHKKKKRRKRNRSTYASPDELPMEKRNEWLQKEFYKTDSKRAMKVRVIRIE